MAPEWLLPETPSDLIIPEKFEAAWRIRMNGSRNPCPSSPPFISTLRLYIQELGRGLGPPMPRTDSRETGLTVEHNPSPCSGCTGNSIRMRLGPSHVLPFDYERRIADAPDSCYHGRSFTNGNHRCAEPSGLQSFERSPHRRGRAAE